MIFHTASLLSKWGFGDGDMLGDLLYEHGYRYKGGADDEQCHEHRVLSRVVEEHVAPKVSPPVETHRIFTIHNPIRADTVGGLAWAGAYGDSQLHKGVLSPETVEVPDEVILAIAREEAEAS